MSDPTKTLAFTGERFVPECVREMAYEHWHRYAWAQGLIAGLDVLDVASGEGYGAHLLAQRARSVVGVDQDPKAIAHATACYVAPNLRFEAGDALRLSLDDDSIDCVVCFETIEHLEDHDALLTEFKRVLRPDGCVLLSSPDKASYSDQTGYDNPYHTKELYRQELEALLEKHFPVHRLWTQKLTFASAIWPCDSSGSEPDTPSDTVSAQWWVQEGGDVTCGRHPGYQPQYFIAMAAQHTGALLSVPELSLFSDVQESIYQHYQDEIRHHMESGALLDEKQAEIDRLKAQPMSWWRRWWSR